MNILNNREKQNKIQQMIAIFIKAIIFVRRGHCDYSPQEPEHLTTPLGMPEAKPCPTWDLSNWHDKIKTLRWLQTKITHKTAEFNKTMNRMRQA
jgi:hypothetical protein